MYGSVRGAISDDRPYRNEVPKGFKEVWPPGSNSHHDEKQPVNDVNGTATEAAPERGHREICPKSSIRGR